ncbi:MAG: carbohydrate ABC transporter permease [Lachnospiraceae bacterium]|nr:carbohydrate ABC transporter permease [Lachnospiraceae bacterium]
MIKKKKYSMPLFVLAFLITLLVIFPIIWLFMSSFKGEGELFAYPLHFFPQQFSIANYEKVLRKGFMQYVQNSFFIAVMSTVITLAICGMAGYALAVYRKDFKWSQYIFLYFIVGTLVPGEVQMIPKFDIILATHLYNNIWGVILPVVASTTGIFLYRQFFVSMPMDIVEAARIDGAGEIYIFTRIMLPLAKTSTLILTIFSFMWRWNDYILPMVVLNKQKNYTIQIAIRNYIGNNGVDWPSIIAGSCMSIIPVLLVFMVLQKYIIGGIATSGMKN